MSTSIRRLSTGFAAVMVLLGAGMAIALIAVTSQLHSHARELVSSIEAIRINEQLELSLAELQDASTPQGAANAARDLQDEIAEAAHYLSSRREEQLLADIQEHTKQLVAATDGLAAGTVSRDEVGALYGVTFDTVRELIRINVVESRDVSRLAARWDQSANLLALACLALLAIALGLFVWFLRALTVRPTLNLIGTIEQYAHGWHDVRATEHGPTEFRTIAQQFNLMASTLDEQRKQQLAFLAGVAHDLRNPLSALKMTTALISPDDPLPSEARVRQLFSRVDRQIDRMSRMVHDLLDAARVESGDLELKMELCDARELVHATLELFEAGARTHQLTAIAEDEPVQLRCDPTRIEQVLANLVSNALKYSPSGGHVRVRLQQGAEYVRILVEDDGIGMAREDLPKLFQPFRRVGASKGQVTGVGLGLFVARRIVEGHGGTLSVESELGRGSTFVVDLPAPAAEAPAVAQQRHRVGASAG